MMFGVFIRSVEERTERLCWESCASVIPQENIKLIQNRFPAYEAYKTMFEQAKNIGYDWFLGLDADVILKPDWFQKVKSLRKQLEDGDWFVFSCAVKDMFFGKIDRGNHFYNGRHVDKALDILLHKTRNMLKPESEIRHYTQYKYCHFDNIFIGYHGFDQFYRDIFYRFWLRAKRDPNLVEKYSFLSNNGEYNEDCTDLIVARKGWRLGKESWLARKIRRRMVGILGSRTTSNAIIRNKLYTKYLSDLEEKLKLDISLDNFLENVHLK